MSYFIILLSKATSLDSACELERENLANNYIFIQNCGFLFLSLVSLFAHIQIIHPDLSLSHFSFLSLEDIFLSSFFLSLFMAVLGLHCCAWASSSCGERGLLLDAVCRLLVAVASLCCGAWALGTQASVVVALGLSSCSSRPLEHRLSSWGARA